MDFRVTCRARGQGRRCTLLAETVPRGVTVKKKEEEKKKRVRGVAPDGRRRGTKDFIFYTTH